MPTADTTTIASPEQTADELRALLAARYAEADAAATEAEAAVAQGVTSSSPPPRGTSTAAYEPAPTGRPDIAAYSEAWSEAWQRRQVADDLAVKLDRVDATIAARVAETVSPVEPSALEALDARMAALAVDVLDAQDAGDAPSVKALTAAVDKLDRERAALVRREELEQLAAEERGRRRAAEAVAATEARHAGLAERLHRFALDRRAIAGRIDGQLDALLDAIAALIDTGRAMEAIDSEAGGTDSRRYADMRPLGEYLSWRLSQLLPHNFDRPGSDLIRLSGSFAAIEAANGLIPEEGTP